MFAKLPTCDRCAPAPVAWVDRRSHVEIQPLLDWLGISEVRERESAEETALLARARDLA